MNCPKCGSLLPDGTAVCPVCGTPVAQAYRGYPTYPGAVTPPAGQGYPQYPQAGNAGYNTQPQRNTGYQGYTNNSQGYGQAYGRTARERGDFLTAMGNLPHVIRDVFTDPGETLRGMMDRGDRYTGAVVTVLSLLLTFLAAILGMRSMISMLYGGFTRLFGASLAGDTGSMNQGINYIVGKMAASVGGIAAVCQLFAVIAPLAAALIYLCAFKKVRFSFLLASNLAAIFTLPTIAASILCMLFSLVSPVLGGVMILLGTAASYVLLCALLTWITGMADAKLVVTKIAVISAAEGLKILFIWLVGGALTAAALTAVAGIVNSLGSLI
ncbi:MAG TPA: zinc ribbon domain-containing protein [Candidatus Limiplasma sp.]|nr:zinc ribbon domain-containing protein [Candidatus Limiplasma sp.]